MKYPGVKVTAKQIRFVFESAKVWMIQPLRVPNGVPAAYQGDYMMPLDEERGYVWRNLTGEEELEIFKMWVASGFKCPTTK